MPLLGFGSLAKAGERLTDDGVQMGPNIVRGRSFEGDELRARRWLAHVVVEKRRCSLVKFIESKSEGFLHDVTEKWSWCGVTTHGIVIGALG